MKSLKFISLIVCLMIFTVACSSSYSGKYYCVEDETYYIELKSNGEFTISENSGVYFGEYEINDQDILLKVEGGFGVRGRIEEGKLIDPDGIEWVKK